MCRRVQPTARYCIIHASLKVKWASFWVILNGVTDMKRWGHNNGFGFILLLWQIRRTKASINNYYRWLCSEKGLHEDTEVDLTMYYFWGDSPVSFALSQSVHHFLIWKLPVWSRLLLVHTVLQTPNPTSVSCLHCKLVIEWERIPSSKPLWVDLDSGQLISGVAQGHWPAALHSFLSEGRKLE